MWTEIYSWIKQFRKDKKNTQIQVAGDNSKQEQIMYIKEEENEHP